MQIAVSRKPLVSILILCFSLCCDLTFAQQPKRASRVRQRKHNAQIAQIVREIDARRIEQTIRTLVGFGTRNTLSVQNNPKRGIGAARDWLFDEFSKAAAQSGRLRALRS